MLVSDKVSDFRQARARDRAGWKDYEKRKPHTWRRVYGQCRAGADVSTNNRQPCASASLTNAPQLPHNIRLFPRQTAYHPITRSMPSHSQIIFPDMEDESFCMTTTNSSVIILKKSTGAVGLGRTCDPPFSVGQSGIVSLRRPRKLTRTT